MNQREGCAFVTSAAVFVGWRAVSGVLWLLVWFKPFVFLNPAVLDKQTSTRTLQSSDCRALVASSKDFISYNKYKQVCMYVLVRRTPNSVLREAPTRGTPAQNRN